MPGTLTNDQAHYLRGLVRMEIRRQLRKIAGFRPVPGQTEAEAALVLEHFTDRLGHMRDTYRALGGDPDQMAPRGGKS